MIVFLSIIDWARSWSGMSSCVWPSSSGVSWQGTWNQTRREKLRDCQGHSGHTRANSEAYQVHDSAPQVSAFQEAIVSAVGSVRDNLVQT
jgi:hypothetical protein